MMDQASPLLGMEAEIAFRFLRDAPPRAMAYTYDEVALRVVTLEEAAVAHGVDRLTLP